MVVYRSEGIIPSRVEATGDSQSITQNYDECVSNGYIFVHIYFGRLDVFWVISSTLFQYLQHIVTYNWICQSSVIFATVFQVIRAQDFFFISVTGGWFKILHCLSPCDLRSLIF